MLCAIHSTFPSIFQTKAKGLTECHLSSLGFFFTFYHGSVAVGSSVCSPLLKFPPPYFLNTVMFLCNKYCHPNGCTSLRGTHYFPIYSKKPRTFGLEFEDWDLQWYGQKTPWCFFFIFELRPDSESLWKSASDNPIRFGDTAIFRPKKLTWNMSFRHFWFW